MMPRVLISVTGFNLDNLLNKLHAQQIKCLNIDRKAHNELSFVIDIKHFKKAKSILENYEYSFKYLGMAKFKTWIMKNIAILLVVPIAFSLMLVSTRFTWRIEVYAKEEIKEQVISILKQNNIAVGKLKNKNNLYIEKLLLENLDVAQVSCITRGTSLIINISPKLVYTPKESEPLRAKYNGIITNISLISGTMAVAVGDFVSAGDILVYPFTYGKLGEQVAVTPIAEVRAKSYVVGSTKLNASTTELARTGREYTTSSIKLLNKTLFSKKSSKPFAIYETCVYNNNISSVLPIKKEKIVFYELDYKIVQYDLASEKTRLEKDSADLAYKNLPSNSEILDEKTTSLIVNDCLYCTTTLTISTIISN